MKKWLLASLLVVAVLATGCSAKKEEVKSDVKAEDNANKPTVTMTIKGMGDIVIALEPEVAPNTVKNFLSLASEGFYDGLTFHRVIANFMIQGGDPVGDGTGDPGYSIKGEFTNNGVKNDISHVRGVISMARGQSPDSAGSQFFIVHQDSIYLDGDYAAFGEVISGMDVVDKIAAVKTDAFDKPETEVVIEKVTVDAKNFDFSNVEKTQN